VLPAAKTAEFNEMLLHRSHSHRPHKIAETYADIGFDPEVDDYTSALLLNTLQDWHLFHANDFLADGTARSMVKNCCSISSALGTL